MNKKIKWFLFVSILSLCGIILLISLLYLYTPIVDKALIEILNSLGNENFKVSYLKVSGNLFNRVIIENILISFNGDSVSCKKIEFDYSVFDLIKNRFHFKNLTIFQPEIILNNSTNNNADKSESDTTGIIIPFDKFLDFEVSQLTIKDGSLLVNSGIEANKIIDIQLTGDFKLNPDSINLAVSNSEAFWENRELLLNNLSFTITGNPSKITLNKLQITNKHVEIQTAGEFSLNPVPQISLNINKLFVNHDLINLFLPGFPYTVGFTNISGSLRGMPMDFSGEIYLNGVFDSLQINDLETKLHRRDNFIQLTSIDISTNFGNMYGDILVRTEGKNTAKLSLTGVNLKKIGILNQETSISGEIDFNFDNWDITKLTGNGSITLPNLNIAGMLIDTLKLNAVAESGNFAFKDPSKIVISKNSEFHFRGNFSKERILEIQLQTINNQLDTLFDRIGMPILKGGGELSLNLTGPINNPDLNGYVILDSLTYSKLKIYDVEGRLDIKRILQNRFGNFNLDITSGEINEFKLTKGSLKFSIEQNFVFIDTISFISDLNSIFIDGVLSLNRDSIYTELTSLKLKYEDYIIQNNQTIYMNLKSDTLRIRNFELGASDYGSIKLSGIWALKENTADATLQVINTRFEPFNQFFTWKYNLKGLLSVDLNLNGNIYNPVLSITLSAKNLYFDDNLIGALNSSINYQDQELNIEKLNYSYEDSSFVNLSGSIQLPEHDTLFKNLLSPLNKFDLNLNISKFDIENYAFLLDKNFPLQGTVSGVVDLIGTMGEPQGIVKLTGKNAIIEKYDFFKFHIESRISPVKILVDKADINFMDTDIKASGFKNIKWNLNDLSTLFEDKSFELICKIKEDSLNFLYVFIPDVDRVIGKIDVTARFGGSINNPQLLSGTVDIKNSDLYLTKIENPIREIDMKAHVDNKRLYIDQFKGRSPEAKVKENFFKKLLRRFFTPVRKIITPDQSNGEIEVAGNIDFSILDRPKFDIDISLNDAYFNYFLENTRVVVNSDNINIFGRDTISVSGIASLKKGDVELDIEESEKNVLLSKSTRQTPPYIQYLLNVDVPNNLFIRSNAPFNTFDIELAGNVQILQEPMSFIEMYGNLDIIKGKYFIQFEDFDINSGTITFVNPKEYPELNLTAQKQKYNYLFDLTVTGPLNNPQKEMITKNLETNEQIYEIKDQMAILIFGVRFQELSGLGQSAFLQKGEEVLAQTLINQFETEARYFTGLDRIRISTQEAEENYIGIPEDESNQVQTLALGKYIAPNLYLEYQTKLSYVPGLASFPKPSLAWESGNQIYLKYRISRSWSLSSFYQKTLRGNDKVRFDVNWQIDF